MHIESFYDTETSTFTHVVVDPENACCAVIDSVLNYDQDAARATTESADQVIEYIKNNHLKNQWILETHIHADHITAAHYLKQQLGGKTAIGIGIKQVLSAWVPIFDTGHDTLTDGSQFDVIFEEGTEFQIGKLQAKVMLTPGHTPACASYVIENAVFVGDTLFKPELGTARVDFPGGDAKTLFQSIQKLYTLPDDTLMYLCHDYPQDNQLETNHVTVGIQKKMNKMINSNTTLAEFTALREARDKTLSVPKLILPALQTNMRLGNFGQPNDNGIQYIRIPINQL